MPALKTTLNIRQDIVQRAQETAIVGEKTSIKTGLMKKNIPLEKHDKVTADFGQIKKGRVPVFQRGEQVGTVEETRLIRPLKGPSQLPERVSEDDVRLATIYRTGEVEPQQAWLTTYHANEGAELYHGTYASALESILDTGLQGSRGGTSGGSDYSAWQKNCKGFVYLTTSVVNATNAVKLFWLGQEEPDNPDALTATLNKEDDVPAKPTRNKQKTPKFVVLKVVVGESGLALEADPDLSGISFRTKGDVPKEWIKRGDVTEVAAGPKSDEYKAEAKKYNEYRYNRI